MCKPDNRKWLIVTGGLLAVIITLSVILAVTLSGRASGASGVRDPANLRQAVDSIDGIPLFTAYIPEDSPGRPGVLRTVESITIHETANTSEGADAEAHSDYLSTTSDEVSWHYTEMCIRDRYIRCIVGILFAMIGIGVLLLGIFLITVL